MKVRSFTDWSGRHQATMGKVSTVSRSPVSVSTPRTQSSSESHSGGGTTVMRVPLPSGQGGGGGGGIGTPPLNSNIRRSKSSSLLRRRPAKSPSQPDADSKSGRPRKSRLSQLWRRGGKQPDRAKAPKGNTTRNRQTNKSMQAKEPQPSEPLQDLNSSFMSDCLTPSQVPSPGIELKVVSDDEHEGTSSFLAVSQPSPSLSPAVAPAGAPPNDDATRDGCSSSNSNERHGLDEDKLNTVHSPTELNVDYSARRFGSDMSCVEVYLDHEGSPVAPPKPVVAMAPQPEMEHHQELVQQHTHEESQQNTHQESFRPHGSSKEKRDKHFAPAPIPAIMAPNDTSDLVSELSEPPGLRASPRHSRRSTRSQRQQHLDPESVFKVHQAISQLHQEESTLSSKMILERILSVTDALSSPRDRDLIRRQLSQLSSFSDTDESQREAPPPQQHEHPVVSPLHGSGYDAEDDGYEEEEEESYMPHVGPLCHLPEVAGSSMGENDLSVREEDDDVVSETTSFVNWLEQQESGNSGSTHWNVFAEMLDLSQYWSSTTDVAEPLLENDESISLHDAKQVEVQHDEALRSHTSVLTPPKIQRKLSTNNSFRPRSFSQLQYEDHLKVRKVCSVQENTPTKKEAEEEQILLQAKRKLDAHARKRSNTFQPSFPAELRTPPRDMLFVRTGQSRNREPVLVSVPSDEMSHWRYRSFLRQQSPPAAKDTKHGTKKTTTHYRGSSKARRKPVDR